MCVCWFDENYPKFLVYLVHEPRKMHIRGARSDSQTGPRNMSEQSIFIVFLFRLLAIATVNEFTAKYANETGKGRTLKIYRNGIFSRFTINDPKASGYINIQYMQYRARTYRIYRVDSRLQSNTMLWMSSSINSSWNSSRKLRKIQNNNIEENVLCNYEDQRSLLLAPERKYSLIYHSIVALQHSYSARVYIYDSMSKW